MLLDVYSFLHVCFVVIFVTTEYIISSDSSMLCVLDSSVCSFHIWLFKVGSAGVSNTYV